jgi:hypothetical protein
MSAAGGWRWPVVTGMVMLGLAMPAPLFAQGKSPQSHGHASPPSQSTLPPPTAIGRSTGATPFAWLDDATLIAPGGAWLGLSMTRWDGTGASEVEAPVVDVAVGLTPRVQVGASVPHVVGSDTGASGGLGTTYFNTKVAAYTDRSRGLKVAVAPTLEVLSAGAQAAAPDQSRVQWGLPASAELDRGVMRLYASTGYFSRGVWYAGAGGGWRASSRLSLSMAFSRAWATTSSTDPTAPSPNRTDVSGGASYTVLPNVGLFGSIGHTIDTADVDGAGMTLSVGMFFMSTPGGRRVAK